VEKTGWSLEYVDALSMSDLHDYLQIEDARAKSKNSLLVKK